LVSWFLVSENIPVSGASIAVSVLQLGEPLHGVWKVCIGSGGGGPPAAHSPDSSLPESTRRTTCSRLSWFAEKKNRREILLIVCHNPIGSSFSLHRSLSKNRKEVN
jgi:hypothetical protein